MPHDAIGTIDLDNTSHWLLPTIWSVSCLGDSSTCMEDIDGLGGGCLDLSRDLDLGTSFNGCQRVSHANGCSHSNILPIVPLHVTRPVWLLETSPKHMTSTTPRHSPLLFASNPSVFLSLSRCELGLVSPLIRCF